ncbi:hypothetical protein LTR05_005241 [Lithohypha guttulata]|uniref:Uncharacterized protein n=1 Tax=Lithohypha guttulata TaxID=1690604 RepID=A0AAN7YB25_9EURO|nr:hypothetical protein LTR05_005241 [Lithohypha guttulata]
MLAVSSGSHSKFRPPRSSASQEDLTSTAAYECILKSFLNGSNRPQFRSMSQELALCKGGKKPANRFAGTVHPNESASQMSSNVNHEEGAEAGGDAAARMAKAIQAQAEKGSKVSSSSKATVPYKEVSAKPGSSKSKAHSALQIEDVTSKVSSNRSSKSAATTNSKALVPTSQKVKNDATSSVSKSSSAHSSKDAPGLLAIEAAPSQVSKASSSRQSSSSSRSKDNKSTVSSASGSKSSTTKDKASSQVSSASSSKPKSSSRASSKSKALVPDTKAGYKASPLAHEIKAEDLDDDMYSISIHERGPLGAAPANREELLAMILRQNPKLDVDEASVIVDNQIATGHATSPEIGRSKVGARSEVSSKMHSTTSRASSYKGKEKEVQPYKPSPLSTVSKASSTRSKQVVPVQSEPSIVSMASDRKSSASRVPSTKGKEVVRQDSSSKILEAGLTDGLFQGQTGSTSVLSDSSKALVLPNTGLLPALAVACAKVGQSQTSNSSSTTDLLMLAQIRQQRELQRAQAVAAFEASQSTLGSNLAQTRMAELELAKQSLEDSRTLTRLQELGIHNEKLANLALQSHEDQVAALAREEAAQADERQRQLSSALREREEAGKARLRQQRGDISKAERRKEDERDQQTQMEYERMDHDQQMDKTDAFGRLMEAGRPRQAPQPRRSGLKMGYEYGYQNSRTGGEGTVEMRIGKGCNNSGTGVCPRCHREFREHPVKLHSDGGVMDRSGRRLLPTGSDVSKASSSRK